MPHGTQASHVCVCLVVSHLCVKRQVRDPSNAAKDGKVREIRLVTSSQTTRQYEKVDWGEESSDIPPFKAKLSP